MRLSTRTKSLALLLLILAPVGLRAAENEDFVIYEAQTRPADELKKAAGGVVNGGRVSTLGSKLVIYGTKAQREAVLRLFSELDHPIRNYIVRLRIAKRGAGTRDAIGVHTPRGGGSVAVTAESGGSDGEGNDEEQLVVTDGGTARLFSGSVFPKAVTVHIRSIGHSGAHVEIRERDPSAVGEQALVTEIDVPLEEWRTVGGISAHDSGHTYEILGRAKRSSMATRDVQVRVDLEAP